MQIDRMIAELCPNGVEYKPLGEIGKFYGGLSGKSKEDFSNGNAKFITYMNVFSNLAVNTDITDRVKVGETERQNSVKFGDVLFTGSSETPDECGMSAILTTEPDEPLYLNSFCFGFRLFDTSLLLPDFSKYLFRSEACRKQIVRTASGVTRFNVSKEKMKKVRISIPPLAVQLEIVRILDKFTKLTAELTAELTARKKQYEFYRNSLMSFGDGVEFVKLGDVAECYAGATPKTGVAVYWQNGTIPWMNSGEVNNGKVYSTEKKISQLGYDNCSTKMVPANTVVVALAGQGKTRGTVAITKIPLCTNQSLCSIITNATVNSDFLYYYLQTQYQQLRAVSSGDGTRGGLNLQMIKAYKIPRPPLEEQTRIVEILDRFDALTNDITRGLPAEIAARKKQYEYYRDKLLTYKNKTI